MQEFDIADDDVFADEDSSLDTLQECEENNGARKTIQNSLKLKTLDWITDYVDPDRFTSSNPKNVYSLFNEISHQESVSDIIISPGLPVLIKVKRRGLFSITKRCLDYTEAAEMVRVITNDANALTVVHTGKPLSGLARLIAGDVRDIHAETDYVEYEFQQKTRYRYEIVGSSSSDREHSFSMVMRPLPMEPPKYSDIKLPIEFVNQCIVKDGMVIIGGATGEGKSTTLSAVIRYIMEHDTTIKGNIITHEDPIEIPYDNVFSEHSYVTQSAIGPHIKTFDLANSAAMRRSSDLVLVGELRDNESVDKAVELSLTGHPVFATTHANNVSAIMPRLLSRFPKEVQTQKCFDILTAARVFASQKLIWRTDNKMMAVREVLVLTPELRNYLKKFVDNPSIVIRKINGIMEKGLFGTLSYEKQGQDLLSQGIITEASYKHLVEAIEISEKESEDFELLDSL